MVRRSNRDYHDRVAGRYDDIYDTPYWRFYREISWRHLRAFLPTARPAAAADLGCGTGWFGLRLLKAGCQVTFLDPSPGMLEQARAAADDERQRGLDTHFVQAGLEDMPAIADASLDFATAQGDPLSFCANPAVALRELSRIVKPNGAVVLSVDHRAAGVRTLLDEPTPDAALELLRTGRTEWRGHRPTERFPMKMFEATELTTLLERAGFVVKSLIAKTCIVQRRHAAWLEDPATRARLLDAEESVHAKPAWFALGSHLQVAAIRSA